MVTPTFYPKFAPFHFHSLHSRGQSRPAKQISFQAASLVICSVQFEPREVLSKPRETLMSVAIYCLLAALAIQIHLTQQAPSHGGKHGHCDTVYKQLIRNTNASLNFARHFKKYVYKLIIVLCMSHRPTYYILDRCTV